MQRSFGSGPGDESFRIHSPSEWRIGLNFKWSSRPLWRRFRSCDDMEPPIIAHTSEENKSTAWRRRTVVIADDHQLMVEGLASLVGPEFEVIGAVSSGWDLLALAATRSPDLALIDVTMPGLSGVETTRKLLAACPRCKVLLISMHAQAEYIREGFRAGASGYVLKRSAASELMEAIREVLKGNVFVSSCIAQDALSSLRAPTQELSPRQREVLSLVAEGFSAKEIAERLSITVKTAQFHKASVMSRLGVHTTAELTKYALGHGIASL